LTNNINIGAYKMSNKTKGFNLFLEAKNSKDERTIDYIASKQVVDEMGRVFIIKGMDISPLKQLKAIFYNHETYGLPIAKAAYVRKHGDEIRIGATFAKPEDYSFADSVYKLVRGKFIIGGSIGVKAYTKDIEYPEKPMKIGGKEVRMIIHKSKLEEFSITPNPANRSAVAINASLDEAIKNEVIDEVEASEFKLVADVENYEPIASDYDDRSLADCTVKMDDPIVLKAKIVELELQLKEQEMEEELEASVYEDLYDEFKDVNKKDKDDKYSVLDEYFK